MTRILVTGAAGFIGSAVAEKLIQQGNTVYALDSYSNYYSQNLKKARAERLKDIYGLKVRNVDLSDKKQVAKFLENHITDVVIHLAAQPGVRLPTSENHKYVRDNLVGFANIANQSCIAEVKAFLYASSSSVYGNSDSEELSENMLGIKPISFYGATKLSNEVMANSLAFTSNTKFRGLRFFTVYGPWGRPDMAYLKIIDAAINKKSFQLFGDGSKARDFTYVTDVVESVIKLGDELLGRSPGMSDIVNIGGGHPVSMNTLIKTIENTLQTSITVTQGQNVLGDVTRTNANTDYLKSLIEFGEFVGVQEGIERTIEWAQEMEQRGNLRNWLK